VIEAVGERQALIEVSLDSLIRCGDREMQGAEIAPEPRAFPGRVDGMGVWDFTELLQLGRHRMVVGKRPA
jgi:hypothetical protein